MFLGQPKNAVFPFSQDLSSQLASLSLAGNIIPIPDSAIEEGKALWAADNLWNASVENQGQMKMYIHEVCRETVSLCCNSFLQQAGLHVLERAQTASPGHPGLLSDPLHQDGTDPPQTKIQSVIAHLCSHSETLQWVLLKIQPSPITTCLGESHTCRIQDHTLVGQAGFPQSLQEALGRAVHRQCAL
ncbi:protein ARMCX6-like [Phacochoerus africanus]|uniref:protein ARMCX6-like n=1 Tax=Phacochoerus africanus TaxID=41426 RepID=UPI001FDACA21|nr:protein ARMCX6-like [Phacochoerus africanus]